MKTLILITLAALFVYGCSKSSTPKPTPQVTQKWISGKWKRTLYVDTVFYTNGSHVFLPISTYNELNFIDTNKVTQIAWPTRTFSYSLSAMTATFDFGPNIDGELYKITKLSDTKIKLDYTGYDGDPTIKKLAYVDVYEKE